MSPGHPATIAVHAGDAQSAAVATPVPVRPAVVVRDVAGNGVPGVSVVFSVEGGGGRVTGDTALTDAAGVAAAGAWQLGPFRAVGPVSGAVTLRTVHADAQGRADAGTWVLEPGLNRMEIVVPAVSAAPAHSVTATGTLPTRSAPDR